MRRRAGDWRPSWCANVNHSSAPHANTGNCYPKQDGEEPAVEDTRRVVRVLVTGGRDFVAPLDEVKKILRAVSPEPATLIHGVANGADSLAHMAAKQLGWEIEPYPADWRKHGKAAGAIRNSEMAKAGADVCIAFPGGRGTADMVRKAKVAGILVRPVRLALVFVGE